jgi:hypothetical protein
MTSQVIKRKKMFITNAYGATDDTISVTESASSPKATDKISSNWTSMIPMVLI